MQDSILGGLNRILRYKNLCISFCKFIIHLQREELNGVDPNFGYDRDAEESKSDKSEESVNGTGSMDLVKMMNYGTQIATILRMFQMKRIRIDR